MKTILQILLLCFAFEVHADSFTTVKVVFSALPADGDTITVNGDVRTFKTTVTTAATQITRGASAAAAAANYFAQVTAYPYTSINPAQNSTTISLIGNINVSVTASKTGSWGSVAATVNSLTQKTLNLPLALEPSATRAPMANYIVDALNTNATTEIKQTATTAAQLVGVSNTQTITGTKTMTATTLSGGVATNTQLKKVIVPYIAGGVAQGTYYRNSGGTDASVIFADSDGFPVMYSVSAGVPASPLEILPTDGHVLNKLLGNYLYPQLAAKPNVFLGTNRFAQITNTVIAGGSMTNTMLTNVVIGATAAYMTNADLTATTLRGATTVSNQTTSLLRFSNSAASADEKHWDQQTVGPAMTHTVYSDDFLSSYTWLAVARTAASVSAIALASSGTIGIGSSGIMTLNGSRVTMPNTLVIGTDMSPAASQTAGLQLNNGTAATAAPASGVAVYAASDDLLYWRTGDSVPGRGHNATAKVVGSGTDYSFGGTTYVRIDFGGTDPEIVLPTAGTYTLTVLVPVVNGATAVDAYSFKLYNSTDAADIADSEQTNSALPASGQGQVVLIANITVTASKTIQLYGKNATAARGSVKSTQTLLRYVREY